MYLAESQGAHVNADIFNKLHHIESMALNARIAGSLASHTLYFAMIEGVGCDTS